MRKLLIGRHFMKNQNYSNRLRTTIYIYKIIMNFDFFFQITRFRKIDATVEGEFFSGLYSKAVIPLILFNIFQ